MDFIRQMLAQKERRSPYGLDMTKPLFKRLAQLIAEAQTLRESQARKLASLHDRAARIGAEEELKSQLQTMRQNFLDELQSLREQAFNSVFKLDGSTDPLVARDALNQATAMHDEHTAKGRYWLAKQSGDETLVSALALRAWQKNWRPILEDYFNSYSDAAVAWQLFERIDSELNSSEAKIRTAAYFRAGLNHGTTGAYHDAQAGV